MAVTATLYPSVLSAMTLPGATMDLSTDTLAVRLMGAAFAYNAAHTVWADVSASEIAAGNGYTAGGLSLNGQTFGAVGNALVLDADDVQWSASGGDIGPAHHAVIVDTTDGNALVGAIDFGGAQTAGDGTPFKLTWSADGILEIAIV